MNLGRLKVIMDRELTYVSRFNFFMVAYLFFEKVGWNWWYLLLVPPFLLWIYIDLKYVMPKEGEYLARKNPFFTKLMKNTEK
jgi:hypothetical protein